MNKVGEIKRGKDIGRKNSMQFQWCACVGCGKERWVMMVRGKPETTKCQSCSKIGCKLTHANKVEFPPQEGIVVKGIDIGYKDKKTKYTGESCPNCGLSRWVQVKDVGKYSKCRKCLNKGRTRENSGSWKGGIKSNHAGYKMVLLQPNDPYYSMLNRSNYVMEHRLVMAKHIGRCLLNWEVVHHINGIKDDNRIENLKLIACNGEHNTQVEQALITQAKLIKKLESEIAILKLQLNNQGIDKLK
jgi:hypothetical protein